MNKKSCNTQSIASTIQDLASQCVKCGLCLPHCPTYKLSENENESPRGRIALLQGFVESAVDVNSKSVSHLDLCLTCRHCERVCPAHVEYGQLITLGRQWLAQEHPKTQKPSIHLRLLQWAIKTPQRIRIFGKLLRLLQWSRLRTLARLSGLTYLLGLRALDQLLPPVPQQVFSVPSTNTNEESVGLFLGCLSRWCDNQTALASQFVLKTCGFNVVVPDTQGCCGAMALHHGDHETSRMMLLNNTLAFNDPSIKTILTTASGCGTQLQEASTYFQDPELESFEKKIEDISHFVLRNIPNKSLAPLNLRVGLHTPCTLQNGMKQAHAPFELLSKIPNLTCVTISDTSMCCGSAGTYMIEHSDWALLLADTILKNEYGTLDVIVTSNIGCGLHLQKILNSRNIPIKVLHPIVLFASSLGWKH